MFFIRGLIAVLLTTAAASALSQSIPDAPDRYRKDVAGARPQPEYDPLGVRLGTMMARIDTNFNLAYNSNIFGSAKNVEGDLSVALRPTMKLNSDWDRNAVSLNAGADFTRYKSREDQNTDELNGDASGLIELGSLISLRPKVEYAREAEPRGSSGNRLLAGDPPYFTRFSLSLESRYTGNNFAVETLIVHRRLRYSSIKIADTVASQRFRDSNGLGGRVTFLYTISPTISALTVFVADKIANPYPEFCCTRDAHGYAILGGIRFDNAGLITGQAALGYRGRDFKGPQPSVHGLTYNARIEWYPTALITTSFTADQEVRNSGIPASSAALVGTQAIRIDYELLRNFIINTQLERETTKYKGLSTKAKQNTISIQANFIPRRMLQISASISARFNKTNREIIANSYHAVQTTFNIRFRL